MSINEILMVVYMPCVVADTTDGMHAADQMVWSGKHGVMCA